MMIKYFVLALTYLTLSMAHAAVQTDTHTYIVSKKENVILVIDRNTGEEKKANIGTPVQSIILYEKLLYAVCRDFNLIRVIDPKTLNSIKDIPVGKSPKCMVIHGRYGFVMNRDSSNIIIIDLHLNHPISTISLGETLKSMSVHNNYAYVASWFHNKVYVINLTKQSLEKEINLGIMHGPTKIIIQGDTAYVLGKDGTCVSVIDLNTHTELKRISVGMYPKSMAISSNFLYVVNQSSNTISVIDLKENKVIQNIPTEKGSCSITIHEGVALIRSKEKKFITVIDLHTHKPICVFSNPDDLAVDFSDTHLYLGKKKTCALQDFKSLQLFKNPYPGIEGISYEDPDKAFSQFEEAVLKKDYKAGKENYEIAISQGHKKANAVAAYAFTHGLWGARKNDVWANQFFVCADLVYFLRLDHEGAFPYDLLLKPEPVPVLAKPVKAKKNKKAAKAKKKSKKKAKKKEKQKAKKNRSKAKASSPKSAAPTSQG